MHISFVDINECSADNGGCSVNAQCTNVIGGNRICTCNAGFTGDGLTCTGSSRMLCTIIWSSFLQILTFLVPKHLAMSDVSHGI